MEVRVYAENPMENFLPDIGTLIEYQRPHGPGIRVDDGFEEGMEIPIYYDPMISKLITYGKDREEARLRMIRACEDYKVVGLTTTLAFGKYVMENEHFISGDFDTHFVDKHYDPKDLISSDSEEEKVAALVLAHLLEEKKSKSNSANSQQSKQSAWKTNRTK